MFQKKLISIILAVLMLCTVFAGCANKSGSSNAAVTDSQSAALSDITVRVFGLKGPTGMGMAKLMADHDNGTAALNYSFTMASAPDELTAEIIKGDYEIAAVPTNLAAVLYAKTNGALKIAAVNTLGVLYVVENGKTINSISDLEGKTIYASGQGSTPEYILNYILTTFNVHCNVEYLSEHSEVATKLTSTEGAIGVLPVPNVTTVLTSSSTCRTAIDLNELWLAASTINNDNSSLYQGCIVVNNTFANEHPRELAKFMDEYKASVDFTNNNIDEASKIIAKYSIVPSAAIAKAAIPDANITFITGSEMKTKLTGFLNVLYKFNPGSVGGTVLSDDAYYAAS